MSVEVSENLRDFNSMLRRDKTLSSMYHNLPDEKKQIILEAVVKGSANVKDLLKSLGDLNKTEKELADTHTNLGAKFIALAKATSSMSAPIANAAKAYNDYASSLERMGSSSPFGVKGLKTMRSELSLMKSEMAGFFEVSNRLFTQGFNTKQIESTLKNLRTTFGNEALKMGSELASILQKTPTLRKNPKGAVGTNDMINILEAGQGNSFLQLRKSGLFGNPDVVGNKNAQFANRVKDFESLKERTKDWAASGVPPEVVIADSILKEVQTIAGHVGTIAQFFSSSKSAIGAAATGAGALASGAGAGIKGAGSGFKGLFGPKTLGRLGSRQQYIPLPSPKFGLTRGVGKFLPYAMAGYDIYESRQQGKGWGESLGTAGGGLAGALGGAKLGAMGGAALGSVVPVVGTAIGGALGGLVGGIAGYSAGRWGAGKVFGRTDKGLIDGAGPKGANEVWDDEAAGAVAKYEQMKTFATRDDAGTLFKRQAEMAKMSISGLTGNQKGIESGYKKAQEANDTFFGIQQETIKEERKALNTKLATYKRLKETYEKAGKDVSVIKDVITITEASLVASDKQLQETLLDKVSRYKEALTKSLEETSRGGPELFSLKIAQSSAGAKASQAYTKGGQFEAYKSLRLSNIDVATKERNLAAKNVGTAKSAFEGEADPLKKAEAQKVYNEAMKEFTQKVENLNSAISDSTAWDTLIGMLEMTNSVAVKSASNAMLLSGAWQDLQTPMMAQLQITKDLAKVAEDEFSKKSGSKGFEKGSKGYLDLETKVQKTKMEVISKEFEVLKLKKDTLMAEHEVRSNIMKEQSGFLAEMGGYLSDVLSMKAQALEQDRASIAHLQEFISTANLSGVEKEKAIAELKKKEMQLVRDQVGIQRSAYEKFVGMAFGSLSDKGYKKGRMDTSVIGGTSKTRVRNLAGLASGENTTGLNRDQISGILATDGGRPKAEVAMEASADKIKTGGDSILEAAKIFVTGKVSSIVGETGGTQARENAVNKSMGIWKNVDGGNRVTGSGDVGFQNNDSRFSNARRLGGKISTTFENNDSRFSNAKRLGGPISTSFENQDTRFSNAKRLGEGGKGIYEKGKLEIKNRLEMSDEFKRLFKVVEDTNSKVSNNTGVSK